MIGRMTMDKPIGEAFSEWWASVTVGDVLTAVGTFIVLMVLFIY